MNPKEKNNTIFQITDQLLLDESFRKYVCGSDEKAIEFWEDWIHNHPGKKTEIDVAYATLSVLSTAKKSILPDESEKALDTLLTEISKFEKKSKHTKAWRISFLGIAAAILLLFGFTIGLGISLKSSGQMPSLNAGLMNEIIVPVGEKSQIILSDGTHVWINSGSRLKYPVIFDSESRNIELEGEAYFEVAKQNGSIFTVITHDSRILALGTVFNVKSYPEDKNTQTTVVTGLVKVETARHKIDPVLVKPNQMAVISNSPKPSQVSVADSNVVEISIKEQVNMESVTSWKDQLLVFSDETLEDIAIKMERWFNMRIEITDEDLKKERYTGKFVHNETIYEVLEVIRATTILDYSFIDNKILIRKEQPEDKLKKLPPMNKE